MVPTEWYVNGEAYYAMTALPAVASENLGILTCKERKMIDSGLEQRCQTRQDIVVEHPRETTVIAAWLSRIPHGFVQ